MTYSDTILALSNSLLYYFDEVYHSAETITNDQGIKQPAISLNDEWISLTPSDQKETIYIRRNGQDEVLNELKLSSCSKSYKMQSSIRIVFFRDHAKKHNEIIHHLMQSILVSNVKLKSITRDKFKLLKEESSGDYNFGATTAYFAIDIYIFWDLIPENCDNDFCLDIDNPLKKELCPAVA